MFAIFYFLEAGHMICLPSEEGIIQGHGHQEARVMGATLESVSTPSDCSGGRDGTRGDYEQEGPWALSLVRREVKPGGDRWPQWGGGVVSDLKNSP